MDSRVKELRYALITPARNEESHLQRTIESVLRQSLLPKCYVIVSDCSSDKTDLIAQEYAEQHNWIVHLRMSSESDKAFASKAYPINKGFEYLSKNCVSYEILGCVDADISFDEDYFEFLIAKFEADPSLGVAGTDYVEGSYHSYRDTFASPNHVNGQCQLFRKRCFRDIGGFRPTPFHGEDWYAVTYARYRGWTTASFHEKVFVHHRRMGTSNRGPLAARFLHGRKDYVLGNSFLWQLLRSAFQIKNRPYVLGAVMLLIGYLWGWARDRQRRVPEDLVRYHQNSQFKRLWRGDSRTMVRPLHDPIGCNENDSAPRSRV